MPLPLSIAVDLVGPQTVPLLVVLNSFKCMA